MFAPTISLPRPVSQASTLLRIHNAFCSALALFLEKAGRGGGRRVLSQGRRGAAPGSATEKDIVCGALLKGRSALC